MKPVPHNIIQGDQRDWLENYMRLKIKKEPKKTNRNNGTNLSAILDMASYLIRKLFLHSSQIISAILDMGSYLIRKLFLTYIVCLYYKAIDQKRMWLKYEFRSSFTI